MFHSSKRWMIVAAIGYGVIFSLAFTGTLRITAFLFGSELPEDLAGTIFAASSAIAGTVSVLVYARYQKPTPAESHPPRESSPTCRSRTRA